MIERARLVVDELLYGRNFNSPSTELDDACDIHGMKNIGHLLTVGIDFCGKSGALDMENLMPSGMCAMIHKESDDALLKCFGHAFPD